MISREKSSSMKEEAARGLEVLCRELLLARTGRGFDVFVTDLNVPRGGGLALRAEGVGVRVNEDDEDLLDFERSSESGREFRPFCFCSSKALNPKAWA